MFSFPNLDYQEKNVGKNYLRFDSCEFCFELGFPSGSAMKNPPTVQEPQETRVQSLGREDSLEEGMATQSSILAWRIPWTEEAGGL